MITNLGRIKIVPKGAWVAGTYKELDLVRFGTSSFICIVSSTTLDPSNATDWQIVATDGNQGIAGVNGVDGSTWHSGTVPTGGVDGDYYFKTDTFDIYKKTTGTWGSPIANIKGATGSISAVNQNINFSGYQLQNAEFKSYSETVATPAITAGTLTLDLSTANVFNITHTENITTLTITNIPVSGISSSFTLTLKQDATGGRTLTLPTSFTSITGSVPTISTTANKRNKFSVSSVNNGTEWEYALVGSGY